MKAQREKSWQKPGVITVQALDTHGVEAIRGRLAAKFQAVSGFVSEQIDAGNVFTDKRAELVQGLSDIICGKPFEWERRAHDTYKIATPDNVAKVARGFEKAVARRTEVYFRYVHTQGLIIFPQGDNNGDEFFRSLKPVLAVK